MLEAIREQSKHTLVWVGLAIIIVVFIFFFGPQSQGMGPSGRSWAVKADGVTVYESQIISAFERSQRNNRNLSDGEYQEIKRQIALDIGLVYALAARANETGLFISDNELECYIINWNRNYAVGVEGSYEFPCEIFPEIWTELYPNIDLRYYLQRDGSFSTSYSQDVRGAFQVSVEEYEEYKRAELLSLRYLDLLAAGIPISREQVLSVLNRRNHTVDLEYLALDPSSLTESTPTPTQIEAYIATHPDEIEAYYQAHIDDYTEPQQVRVRRLFIRKPDSADETAFTEAEAHYQALLLRAQGEEDFEALIREHTEIEREKESGGDLGLNPESRMSADVFAAASELEVNGIAGIEQVYAWNIIRLEELVVANITPLEEVSSAIAAILAQETALEEERAVLVARGSRILEIANTAESLESAAEFEATEETTRRNELANVNVNINVNINENENSEENENAPESENSEENEENIEIIIEALRVTTTGPFARETLNPLLQFQGLDPSFEIPPTPADRIPGIGNSRELMHQAFLLTAEAPLLDSFVLVNDINYIVRLNAIETSQEPTQEEFDAVYAELQREFLTRLIDPNQTRLRILTHQGTFSPLLQSILDEEVADGNIRLNDNVFSYTPVENAAVE